MARKLRIEYAGAIYHIINRGNYRRDLFESAGAGESFLRTLFEAASRYGWKIHAYVLMRNHFHLALETPEPNMVDGMHWLQSTTATRFNRFRKESGHLFQGRYQSLLVEDFSALARLVDYIHLNPVRAKIVLPDQVKAYRWSSLRKFMQVPRDPILVANDWLAARGGWADSPSGWRDYERYLAELGANDARWEEAGVIGLGKGWSIGTAGWRKALAKEYAALSLNPGLERTDALALRQARWEEAVMQGLKAVGRKEADLAQIPMKQEWKLKLADQLQAKDGVPIAWLANRLKFGKADSLRGYLWSLRKNTQKSA